ncbi:hypothetical protein PHAVU_009G234000 [Phaseolus vulgaris]|uniref:Auxin efflux carrier component n=1 Tax=Phaseolus vulgaris TaxID=3885 RepID=V7B1K1_PHAVU|nr:hypothetical protein PHAVU_009G234000g [Phaseolus vulgaris]ESW10743.1 hypothetical protein PHAVU_009G234000g [Phaseolus vulgaris]
MIKGKDVYEVVAALVPLYVALFLAYGSVRWWKIFTPEQCSGINRFVSVFAVPFLSFHFISNNNPYTMNFRFLAADSLQKVVILVALVLWNSLTKWGSINWTITLFSLSTLPNTLIMGVPLLKAMYGDFTATLMIQIVVFQSVIWYTLLLFMFEYRGAKLLISEQFPESAGAIATLRVDSSVSSLNGTEALHADAEIGEKGELHVVVRSMPRSVPSSFNKSYSTPRSSNAGFEKGMVKNEEVDTNKNQQMPRAKVMINLILTMVWRNLIRNPNTYASILGLIWSLIFFRWSIKMPSIIKGSIEIISNTGLGMAMFSLGLFMALQPKIITCGKTLAALAFAIKFLVGPFIILATSKIIGIHGVLLRVTIVQAVLPQGIVPFVFAREYNLHTDILSTAVIFGMVVALPVTIIYYAILGL